MAHFAKLNQSNIVEQVIVVHNNELLDENGNESEQKGIDFCQSLFGADTRWVQTSYNNKMRKQFAGIGSYFDADNDVFIWPQPYPSWSLDIFFNWRPPTPMPTDGQIYNWVEDDLNWQAISIGDN